MKWFEMVAGHSIEGWCILMFAHIYLLTLHKGTWDAWNSCFIYGNAFINL